MSDSQSSFFYGTAVAPEVNSTDALLDELESQVATVTTANTQAQASSAAATAAANNAAISEANVATLSQQANDTLSAANAAASTATTSAASAASSATAASGSATSAASSAASTASDLAAVTTVTAPFLSPQPQYTFTSTAGQTVWTLPGGVSYVPGSAEVYVNGIRWNRGESYNDSVATKITFVNPLPAGWAVAVNLSVTTTYPVTGVSSSDLVGFLGANGVATNVTGLASGGSGLGSNLIAYGNRTLTQALTPIVGKSIYVVVLTGQSNAAGAHNGGPNPANPLVRVWDGTTGAWGSSDYTQNPFARGYPDGNNGNNNVGLALAHRLADQTGAKVYVIYDAWGGRPIEDWVSSGTASVRYAAIHAKVQAALASPDLSGITTIDYLMWAQGEENALTDDAPTYQGKFTTLDAQFRAETWMTPTTPMLVMGMSGLHTRYQVWQAQLNYCESVNRACIYVNSSGLKTSYDVTASLQVNVDSTTNFNVNDTVTNTVSGITATGTVTAVGTSVLSIGGVSGVFQVGPITSSSGGSANITALVGASDYTHFLGDALWEHGYHRAWYALAERGMSHRLSSPPFYGRGSGPWSPGNTVAISLFKSLVSNSSATSTFPLNGPSAADSISWGFQCSASNNSYCGGYQNSQNSLARYGMMAGRSLTGNSGADYHAAFGYQNTVSNTYQMVAGRGNSPAHSGETAVGLFSKYTTTQTNPVLLQVGCGTTTSNAVNALTCRADGTVELNANHTSDPTQNKEVTFEWASNTSLKIKMRGADGVVRSATITLA